MKISSNNYISKIFIGLVLFVFLTGCPSVKPSGVKSGKNLFETFYLGEGGTQYFIKPMIFYNTLNREEIHLDFTFRYKNIVKDSVIVNLSLHSSILFKSINSLRFANTTHKILRKDIRLLFNEKRNKQFNSRFYTKISLIEFNKLFDNEDWTIIVYTNKTSNTYISEKKVIKKLQEKIFIILQ